MVLGEDQTCPIINFNCKQEKNIEIYNFGNHQRSFTYIDDLISNLFKIMNFYKKTKIKEKLVFN